MSFSISNTIISPNALASTASDPMFNAAFLQGSIIDPYLGKASTGAIIRKKCRWYKRLLIEFFIIGCYRVFIKCGL